jgi:hypothetical protein
VIPDKLGNCNVFVDGGAGWDGVIVALHYFPMMVGLRWSRKKEEDFNLCSHNTSQFRCDIPFSWICVSECCDSDSHGVYNFR